jgi:hypothetical protein
MNWIEVTDQTQLNEFRTSRKSILAQDQYGNIGYVYWNSYDWVYDIPTMDDELEFSGMVVKYMILK